jgi:dipeptidyl aminopeptidase/acylaminoacyl peptidase
VSQQPGPDGAQPAQVWVSSLGSTPRLVADRADGYSGLCWSPDGTKLAVLATHDDRPGRSLRVLDVSDPAAPVDRPLASWPGSAEEARWSADGSQLMVLVTDPGSDLSSLEGARRLNEEVGDPVVRTPTGARRRLHLVQVEDGRSREVEVGGHNVWEFDWTGGDVVVAVASEDPGEDAWYVAVLVTAHLPTGAVTVRHRPQWQLAVPRISPDGRSAGVVEGFGSDRGLVVGSIVTVDLASGAVTSPAPELETVGWFAWTRPDTLHWTSWSGVGSACGRIDLTEGAAGVGSAEVSWSGAAALGHDSQTRFSVTATGTFAAVLEDSASAPEVALLADGSTAWETVTSLNASLVAELDLPVVTEVSWTAADGTVIEGLVARRRDADGPQPMVVIVHGGPSSRFTHSFAPSPHTQLLAHAGYAVLMPNPRGSSGRSHAFAQQLLGRIGEVDLDDILGGVDACLAAGITVPDRVAVLGKSYGGYMSAWAGSRSDRFAASVPIACISDWVSNHYTSNLPRGAALLLGGDGTPDAGYFAKSPVSIAGTHTTPTLIVHGALDLCTPPGQAEELYNALVAAGTPVELVMYPREGHGVSEYGHKLDLARRILTWLRSYV